MLAHAAGYLARQLGISRDDQEVLAFGLQVLANTLMGFLLVLALGLVLGAVLPAFVAMLAAYSVKVFSGGAHSAVSRNCLAITVAVSGAATLAAREWGASLDRGQALALVFGAGVVCLALFLRFAPVAAKGKSFFSDRRRLTMRVCALASLLLWSAVFALLGTRWLGPLAGQVVVAGEAGLLSVALFLTPAGHRATAWLDRVTNA